MLTVKLSEIALSCEGLVGVTMTMEQSKMVPQMQIQALKKSKQSKSWIFILYSTYSKSAEYLIKYVHLFTPAYTV